MKKKSNNFNWFFNIVLPIIIVGIFFIILAIVCNKNKQPEPDIRIYNIKNVYEYSQTVEEPITITEEEIELVADYKETETSTFTLNDVDWVCNRNIDISPLEYYIFARLVYLENGAHNGYECTYLTASVVVNRLAEYGSFEGVAFANGQYSTSGSIYSSYDMNEQTIIAIEEAYNNPVKGIYYHCMGHLFDDYYELYKEVDGECFYYGGE